MSLPYSNPSIPSATNPYFQDNSLVRGDQMRNNNVAIWGNFDYLNWNILTAKTTLADGDLFGIADSAASFVYKPITWANIIIALKAIAYKFAASGSCIQALYQASATLDNTTSNIPDDNSIPQNDEGKQYFTQAITPIYATSTLRIEWGMYLSDDASGIVQATTLFVDSATDAIAATLQTSDDNGNTVLLHYGRYEVSAASTSARTYALRYGVHTGTCWINSKVGNARFGGVWKSWMSVQEIRA